MSRQLPTVVLPLAVSGTVVNYRGKGYVVDYVSIGSKGARLYLVGLEKPVWQHDSDLGCPLYEIDFEKIRKQKNI